VAPTTAFMVTSLLPFVLLAVPARAGVQLVNGGFEAPYSEVDIGDGADTHITGRLAHGWTDNSGWAKVVIEYSECTTGPHGGKSAQAIDVVRIGSGGVQLTQDAVQLVRGEAYTARIYARTPNAVPLRVQVRQPGAPYTSYAEHTFQPGVEWTKCEFAFPSLVSGPVLFMLLPGDVGTIIVDDASLEAADLGANPPKVGNLLQTGRMVGFPSNGWAPSNAGPEAFTYLPPRPGSPAPRLVIDGSAGEQVGIYSPPVVVNPKRLHTLSMDLKADRPDARVWVTVRDCVHDQTGPGQAWTLTEGWKRYSLSAELPFVEACAFAVRVVALGEARVSVRNMQLVEGEGPVEFEPAQPAEVAVVPEAPHGLYFPDQAVRLALRAAGAIPQGAQMKLSLYGVYGATTALPPLPVPAGDGYERTYVLPGGEGFGMYRLEAQIVDAAGRPVSNVGQGLFARVVRPRYPDELRPDSAFGVHIPLNNDYARLAQDLGFKWCRIHDASMVTKWPSAELEPGKFVFYDDRVRLARSRGIMVLGMLDGAPPWASTVPERVMTDTYRRRYFVPNDIDQWRSYVRTVVGHYRGLIDDWEVWNEPWASDFFLKVVDGRTVQGVPEDYVPLLKAAYEEAHAANPDARVVGIDSSPPEWTEGCLKAGAGSFMDAFSLHQYTRSLAGRESGALAALVAVHRKLLVQYGLPDTPVWDTEGGPDNKVDTFYRDLDPIATSDGRPEAVWYARYYLTTMALGVKKFFFYTLHSYPRLGQYTWVRIDPGGYLKPWAVAQANLAHLVDGIQFVRQVRTASGAVAYFFRGDGRTVLALFSDASEPPSVPALAGAGAIDLYGNPTDARTLGPAPIYVAGPAAQAVLDSLTP
jgi:hypothetical protein